MKVLVGTFNQENVLAGAFSVIVKSSGTFGQPSFEALTFNAKVRAVPPQLWCPLLPLELPERRQGGLDQEAAVLRREEARLPGAGPRPLPHRVLEQGQQVLVINTVIFVTLF